jgi:replicative superfamily II helicase
MYNTKFICTYNAPEVFQETDSVTNEEKEFVRETLYRAELLNILGIEEFNEEELNKAIHNLYEKIKDCKQLKECMENLTNRFMSEDLELGLMILFAYDYMYLSYICINEYLETGQVSEKSIWNLRAIIF